MNYFCTDTYITMKKNKLMNRYILLIITAIYILVISCANDAYPAYDNEEITVLLNYSLMQSGSMSRTAEEVYFDFYLSCVKSKRLAPKSFELNFKTDDNNTIKNINGIWDNNEEISLREGTYNVSGASYPQNAKSTPKYAGDSLWLAFNEAVYIHTESKTINLTANYDCFLLMFGASNINSITAYYDSRLNSTFTLNRFNNIYYIFVNQTYELWASSIPIDLMLRIKRPSGTEIILNLNQIPFETGKYYYFNDITCSFNLDPMSAGNYHN